MPLIDYSREFQIIVDTFEKSGGKRDIFKDSNVTSLVVSGNKVLGKNVVEGIHVDINQLEEGVEIFLIVDDNIKVTNPIHMCFGIVNKRGRQQIISHYNIGNNVNVEFLAHCSFPKAVDILHQMDANITIGNSSVVKYNEVHYHGPEGGIKVIPKASIKIGNNSYYSSMFKLIEGAVGDFNLDYNVYVGDNSVAELFTKLFGKKKDIIKIKESIYLNGKASRGIAKTRIVNTDHSESTVMGEVIGNGDYSRGHVDCTEIIEGKNAKASAIPLVKVTNPLAKVTHEAAIGSVDKNQVETLMARGLTENEAINIIVKGLLK